MVDNNSIQDKVKTNLSTEVERKSKDIKSIHSPLNNNENNTNVGDQLSTNLVEESSRTSSVIDDFMEIATVGISSWILKKDMDGSIFAVYMINVEMKSGLRWCIQKRYQEFRSLRRQIISIRSDLESLKFPSKNWFFNLSDSILLYRVKLLKNYLTALIQIKPRILEIGLFLQIANYVSQSIHRSPSLSTPSVTKRKSISFGSLSNEMTTKDFEILKVLGKGSFGKVFLVRPNNAPKCEVYAMKVLKKSEVVKRGQIDHTKSERRIMAEICHPYILSLRFAFQTEDQLFMITDFCAGGELFYHLKKMRRFTEPMMKFYSIQISLALQHLHASKVVYRDLKPENLLLDRDGNCKLTDFGLSKMNHSEKDSKSTFCGTPEYLSPEMITHRNRGSGYGFEIDWWALGIVCFELLTGWPPFFDRDFQRMCEKILNRPLGFPTKYNVSPDAQNFIKSLLQRQPSNRLGCGRKGFAGLKNHSFYHDTNWEYMLEGKPTPPYMPTIGRDPDDTRNFDKEFTKLDAEMTPVRKDEKKISDKLFEDWTYVDCACLLEDSDGVAEYLESIKQQNRQDNDNNSIDNRNSKLNITDNSNNSNEIPESLKIIDSPENSKLRRNKSHEIYQKVNRNNPIPISLNEVSKYEDCVDEPV